jgi:hypothetical protein
MQIEVLECVMEPRNDCVMNEPSGEQFETQRYLHGSQSSAKSRLTGSLGALGDPWLWSRPLSFLRGRKLFEWIIPSITFPSVENILTARVPNIILASDGNDPSSHTRERVLVDDRRIYETQTNPISHGRTRHRHFKGLIKKTGADRKAFTPFPTESQIWQMPISLE